MTSLKCPRAKLRRFQLSDFENMRLLESDLEVVKNIPKRVPQKDEEILKSLKDQIAAQKYYEPFGIWAATTKEDDFIGWFMLKPKDDSIVELGYMVVQKLWGLGYATEVCKSLIEFARSQNPDIDVVAKIDADNEMSCRVLEKLGFELVDEGNLYDKHFDIFIPTKFFSLRKI
jgi:[ribosomal protein S5]-alanine N-acetyltransferase